jgi:uncharacterized protein DUF2252
MSEGIGIGFCSPRLRVSPGIAIARYRHLTVAFAGYVGKSEAFDQTIGRFSMSYADQAERDHTTFMDAIRKGRIEAQMEHWAIGNAMNSLSAKIRRWGWLAALSFVSDVSATALLMGAGCASRCTTRSSLSTRTQKSSSSHPSC